MAGTIWFWNQGGAAATTSLFWDDTPMPMRVLITMALSIIKFLPVLP